MNSATQFQKALLPPHGNEKADHRLLTAAQFAERDEYFLEILPRYRLSLGFRPVGAGKQVLMGCFLGRCPRLSHFAPLGLPEILPQTFVKAAGLAFAQLKVISALPEWDSALPVLGSALPGLVSILPK